MDSIYLHGAEEVRQAASSMRTAAEDMNRAAMTITAALDQQQRFLTDWIERFETALAERDKAQ